MAKAYLVVTYRKISNPDKWQAYAKLAGVCIPKLGGRFIIRGMPVKTYEKGMNERGVVVEFDNAQKAMAAHDSPESGEALKALGDGAERDMRLVEGVA